MSVSVAFEPAAAGFGTCNKYRYRPASPCQPPEMSCAYTAAVNVASVASRSVVLLIAISFCRFHSRPVLMIVKGSHRQPHFCSRTMEQGEFFHESKNKSGTRLRGRAYRWRPVAILRAAAGSGSGRAGQANHSAGLCIGRSEEQYCWDLQALVAQTRPERDRGSSGLEQ